MHVIKYACHQSCIFLRSFFFFFFTFTCIRHCVHSPVCFVLYSGLQSLTYHHVTVHSFHIVKLIVVSVDHDIGRGDWWIAYCGPCCAERRWTQ